MESSTYREYRAAPTDLRCRWSPNDRLSDEIRKLGDGRAFSPVPDESPPYPACEDGAQKHRFMNHELLQIAGALLVLSAFALTQLGVLNPKAIAYLALNIIGAGVLAWLAWTGRDWGFLLLEGVWTIVSAISLAAVLRQPATRTD